MSLILSIQSHVAFGYVGNKAAVFPLQCLGFDVVDINTVQFSNHTGYGAWTGQIFTPDHITDIIKGLRDRGAIAQIGHILTGYMGDPRLGSVILDAVDEIRSHNPDALYCCDPVMGDTGRGFFVKEGIPAFFREAATRHASIMTPNQFELNALTGVDIKSLSDAQNACLQLIAQGVGIVLVTSLEHDETPEGKIQMLATNGRETHIVTTPKFNISVNGSGDCTAALFLGHFLKTANLQRSLELTASGIFGVFEKTAELETREIALIQAQEEFRNAEIRFPALTISPPSP